MKKTITLLLVISLLFIAWPGCKKANESKPVIPKFAYYGWAVGAYQNTNGFLIHTKDGGKNWNAQSNADQLLTGLEDICIIDENTLLTVGDHTEDGTPHVLKSTDGGNNWSPAGAADLINADYCCIYNLNNEHLFIVGDSGSIYHSDNLGGSWNRINVPDKYKECNFLRIAVNTVNDIWVVGDYFAPDTTPIMLHTMDGGASWERPDPIKDLNITPAIGTNGHYLAIKLYGNSIWAIGGFGAFTVRSTDNGTTWTDVSVPAVGTGDANDLFLLSETEAYLALDFGSFFSTSDGGQNWTKYYPQTNDWLLGIAIQDETHIWVCGSPGGAEEYAQVIYSKDAGTTWTDQTPEFMKNTLDYTLYKIRFMKHQWVED
ncbi:MAG: hypothetical protein K9G58_05665 [Bacteroidales bacterium]|nr:hypothetical protein [Bacteroidales bacterium]MCF8387154.1 hypothetical protein [Bacteroidales bacterium]MCF8397632.1 hypothetical protein [Bacteroidales bacterium]